MKITAQATGYRPIEFEVAAAPTRSRQMLDGDKRGVELLLYATASDEGGEWLGILRYITSWGNEREFVRLYQADTLDAMAEQLREAARTILPPGAGFPATHQYETRQAKLAGMLETLTLAALSDVLATVEASR